MNCAAATFGKILQVGGPSFTENVLEMEVQRAADLMTLDKTEYGRYAGILILSEIATHASDQFYRYVGPTLEKVVIPLKDQRVSCAFESFLDLFNTSEGIHPEICVHFTISMSLPRSQP